MPAPVVNTSGQAELDRRAGAWPTNSGVIWADMTAPDVTTLTPATAAAGGAAVNVAVDTAAPVYGYTALSPYAAVTVGGVQVPSTATDADTRSASVTPGTAGTKQVGVRNPNGLTGATRPFVVT